VGLLPYLAWNALNGWPTWEFYHQSYQHYGNVDTGSLDFFVAQVGQLNPVAVVLAAAGLVFYFRRDYARYRLLGWTFVFFYLALTVLRTKPYFLAPAYPILFAAGAVAFERLRLRPWLAWTKPAYVALLALSGILLAPDVMPILPPSTALRVYGALSQPLADRLGWERLTRTVEQVDAALPPAQRASACVLTSNYGEAGALQLLAAPGRLPPVISGHNTYYLWGPGTCTGQVLILVGYSPSDVQGVRSLYAHVALAATEHCPDCVIYEQAVPIYVLSGATSPIFPQRWPVVKHFD
jgi:hypothetical protein